MVPLFKWHTYTLLTAGYWLSTLQQQNPFALCSPICQPDHVPLWEQSNSFLSYWLWPPFREPHLSTEWTIYTSWLSLPWLRLSTTLDELRRFINSSLLRANECKLPSNPLITSFKLIPLAGLSMNETVESWLKVCISLALRLESVISCHSVRWHHRNRNTWRTVHDSVWHG